MKEIELQRDYLNQEPLESIYFGGGTPSLLNAKELENCMQSIFAFRKVEPNAEITLEANPDDLSPEKATELKQLGINRLSIGVQSFFDEDLKGMNRAHNAAEALNAIKNTQKAGFESLSVDLIYGSPGLSDERWKQNLQLLIDLNIAHISCYALTVEPRTALVSLIKKGTYENVNDEQASRQFDIMIDTLGAAGFEQYELSNFAREKKYARHNSNYWKGKHYLGVGPSAHSFNGVSRSWNIGNNQLYIKGIEQHQPERETEMLSPENQFNEYLMTGLRTMWGCRLDEIEKQFGRHRLEQLLKDIQPYLDREMINVTDNTLLLQRKGKFFADGIAADLFVV